MPQFCPPAAIHSLLVNPNVLPIGFVREIEKVAKYWHRSQNRIYRNIGDHAGNGDPMDARAYRAGHNQHRYESPGKISQTWHKPNEGIEPYGSPAQRDGTVHQPGYPSHPGITRRVRAGSTAHPSIPENAAQDPPSNRSAATHKVDNQGNDRQHKKQVN
jgi:hypothetical protein